MNEDDIGVESQSDEDTYNDFAEQLGSELEEAGFLEKEETNEPEPEIQETKSEETNEKKESTDDDTEQTEQPEQKLSENAQKYSELFNDVSDDEKETVSDRGQDIDWGRNITLEDGNVVTLQQIRNEWHNSKEVIDMFYQHEDILHGMLDLRRQEIPEPVDINEISRLRNLAATGDYEAQTALQGLLAYQSERQAIIDKNKEMEDHIAYMNEQRRETLEAYKNKVQNELIEKADLVLAERIPEFRSFSVRDKVDKKIVGFLENSGLTGDSLYETVKLMSTNPDFYEVLLKSVQMDAMQKSNASKTKDTVNKSVSQTNEKVKTNVKTLKSIELPDDATLEEITNAYADQIGLEEMIEDFGQKQRVFNSQ